VDLRLAELDEQGHRGIFPDSGTIPYPSGLDAPQTQLTLSNRGPLLAVLLAGAAIALATALFVVRRLRR